MLEALSDGRTHTREDLRTLDSDRKVRDAVSELRDAGEAIVSVSSGRGYVLTTDPALLEPTFAEMFARARTTMRRAWVMRRTITRLRASREAADPVQLSLGEVA